MKLLTIAALAIFGSALASAVKPAPLPVLAYKQDPPPGGTQPLAFGVLVSSEGVEPATHYELVRVNRASFPEWLKPVTFHADRAQLNVVAGYNAQSAAATAGWSATLHWGVAFLGIAFTGEIQSMRFEDLKRHLRFTLGVQF